MRSLFSLLALKKHAIENTNPMNSASSASQKSSIDFNQNDGGLASSINLMDFWTKDYEKQNKKTKILPTAQKHVSWKLLCFNWRWNSAKRLDWCLQYARHANMFFHPKSETTAMIIHLVEQSSIRCFRCFCMLDFDTPGIIEWSKWNSMELRMPLVPCRQTRVRTRILDVNGNIKFNDDDDMVQYARSHEFISTHLDDVQCSVIVVCGFVVFGFFFFHSNNWTFNSDCVAPNPKISLVRVWSIL